MTMRKWMICGALILIATIMQAQDNMRQRLDSLLNAMAADNRAMGSICISHAGKVIYHHTTGFSSADAGNRIAAQDGSKYRIASVTKMFTAAIICQLVQEGKIDFSNTLDEYYPQLPGASKITIGMMLSHRSGLHNILDDPDYLSWKETPKTQDEMLKLIGKYPLDFTPDAKSSYSNSNFVLLGYIIEKVCKKPYSEVVHDRVIAKAGLKNTYYGHKTDIAQGECYSYVYGGGAWQRQPEADMTILGGAGALISTPEDLTKFIDALYARKLLRHRYLNMMQNVIDGFGLGMEQFPFGERVAYGHHGNIDGYFSMLQYFPDDKLAVSYCSNGLMIPITDLINGVLKIVYEEGDF